MNRWNAWGTVLVIAATACSLATAAPTCQNYEQYRQALFGELHLHTEYSVDAATLQTRNTPADAYKFAKGGKVGLPPFVNTSNGMSPPPSPGAPSPAVSAHAYCMPGEKCNYMATRTIQLPKGRELDFAAITDHAEYFGEANICLYEPTRSCTVDSDCNTAAGQTCALGTVCAPKDWADPACILVREEITRIQSGLGTDVFSTYVVAENPERLPFCADPSNPSGNTNCRLNSGALWTQIQNDANTANDPCKFTSFIAYEYTAMPSFKMCGLPGGGGSHAACWDNVECTLPETCSLPGSGAANLHRNIIFKGTSVPPLPVTNLEQPTGCGVGTSCNPGHKQPLASPQALLATLEQTCTNGGSGCDFISIPHNPNISGGAMFLLPKTGEEARLRNQYERLVEIMQIKGSSECRFSVTGAWGTTDENCNFENMSYGRLAGTYFANPGPSDILPGSFVRNALKNGMKYQKDEKDKNNNVLNPFQLGFVGALDNHNGTPGATDNAQYARNGAHGIPSFSVLAVALNELNFLGLETNGGGMTGVWAEENTRDSIFAAMKRRETFATSGTRPVVRFFGGFDVPDDMCRKGNFPAKGYAGGVPMGGTMPAIPAQSSKQPTFAVSAVADPGWTGNPGTKLQQAQIVKGWVDSTGKTYEKVLTVAGDSKNSGKVNLDTCQPSGDGSIDLCGVWTDNEFSPDQRAFYYARVLENQSCRWNQFACNAIAVDCKQPLGACASGKGCNSDNDCSAEKDGGQCITPPSYTQYEYQQCCSALVPKTVQQRAWTSPIFYEPL
ncbi:MAG: DUF3604 domain-containing protein [Betaproteobacteria bacterium]|nr:MAG: DUF3604 domain-containing protein [Betaproteobacteria bacterium]TMH66637.1 MAG: DUF3604 domain-containing protein [Betaproteobacteria bacterium]